jgi:putative ABC transport system permease protein
MHIGMDRCRFYLYHSLRSLGREKQRTAFALFCVVAGVASIVGLQTLGLLVADALTANARATNRGDVALVSASDDFFTAEQMEVFEGMVTEGWATDVTYRYRTQELSVATVSERDRDQGAGRGLILDSFLVDPAVYPFYGQIRALDPLNASLADLLTDPRDVVIGKSLADRHDLAVGDQLRIGEPGHRYTVRGIVPSGSAVPGDNVSPLLLGFLYLDYEAALPSLGLERTATECFFVTTDPVRAAALASRLTGVVRGAHPRTAEELLAQNEGTSRAVGRLVLVVALSALLIGGLGIANTMLVTVTRRTPEIAVLKALGLKGRQVAFLFLIEAAVLGLMGGLIGLPAGLALSRGLLGLTAFFFPTPIAWHLHMLPLVTGLVVGVVVTTVCGFLPAMAAAHTRPLRVLQPDGLNRPLLGRWRSLIAGLVLTAVLGILTGWLLQDLVVGLIGAYVTVVVLSILISLLWAIVWIVERLPIPRWAPLRLALRGIGRNRGRAASTLLALIIGLFAISLITVLITSVLDALEELTSDTLGADLILIAPTDEKAQGMMLRTLEQQPGVTSHAAAASFAVQLTAINGDRSAYEQRIAAYEHEQGAPLTLEQRQDLNGYFTQLSGRDLRGNLPQLVIAPGMGRNLTSADADRPVVLLPGTSTLAPLQLMPGETLTFRLPDVGASTEMTLEIVGISQESVGTVSLGGAIIAPYAVLAPKAEPEASFYLVNVDQTRKDEIVTALIRALPAQAVVLETDTLVGVLAELARQITVLPMLIAALALFAATTMVANTTALVTLERRREIGVMKAVGIKTHQVLGQLLLESGILGLVGGLMALGGVALALMLTRAALAGFAGGLSIQTALPLLALAIGVTLAATLLSAWPASRQRPSNVLRYE